jgi:hypothetical protein
MTFATTAEFPSHFEFGVAIRQHHRAMSHAGVNVIEGSTLSNAVGMAIRFVPGMRGV